ncbi:hypothetical protein [Chryseobacterium caseinilyticum]|uniref:Uncharacterized protein n=1 Tax=Chryseobacterium caseinilyticum TaxID=2771428 RepID=A0ABR8ZCM3_9FLAO|nr:hypothetical protein [Chryseobacterium caseinilyticum]MBD8083002.1 hypothetical protein [Chryseobacterium caseinilyticum]
MEINGFTILKYISDDSASILRSYLEKDKQTISALEKYEEISYLNPSEKFFFLFKEHEKFINRNQEILTKNSEHLLSVMGLLFQIETYAYSHETSSIYDKVFEDGVSVVPINRYFPEEVNIEYNLTNIDSIICYIDIFFNIEIYKTIRRVLNRHHDHSDNGKLQVLNYETAFNDIEFLNFYPFLFKGNSELENHLKYISNKLNCLDRSNIIEYFQVINNKFYLIFEEIFSRTKCNYTKCYNFYDFRQRAILYIDDNDEALIYLEKFFQPRKHHKFDYQYYITFFSITVDFKLPDLQFIKDYDKKYYFDIGIRVLESFHGHMEMIKHNAELEENNALNNDLKKLINGNKYKNLLKININCNKAIILPNGFIDTVLSGNKELKKDFKALIMFLVEDSKTDFPTTNKLTVENIKYIMRFFSKYKGQEFDYSVSNLKYLLTNFAEKPEEYTNSSIDKAHRDKMFDLDQTLQSKLNSLVR